MTDRFTGIGNVRPTYPIKPVEPSGKDRPSGERRKKPPKPAAESDSGNDEAQSPVVKKKGSIDEYI